MKKGLMMLGIATMMLASCTNEDVLNVSDSRAIGFNGTGIDNITKADITSSNFAQFYVYGGYNTTDLFNGTEVNKSGKDWQYNPTQYWKAGNWKFGAYAPKADGAITPAWSYTDGLTLTVNSDATHQNDLIYADATANVTAGEDGTLEGTGNVSLNFTHLLSKLAFKFTKDPQSLGAMTVTMSNFVVAGITTNGQWIAGAQQTLNDDPTPVVGNYSDAAGVIDKDNGVQTAWFYVIPQTVKAFAITADVEVKNGAGDIIKDGTISAEVPTTGQGVITAWTAQNQYLYSAQLSIDQITDPENPNPQPIVFEGSAADWNETIQKGNTTIK